MTKARGVIKETKEKEVKAWRDDAITGVKPEQGEEQGEREEERCL